MWRLNLQAVEKASGLKCERLQLQRLKLQRLKWRRTKWHVTQLYISIFFKFFCLNLPWTHKNQFWEHQPSFSTIKCEKIIEIHMSSIFFSPKMLLGAWELSFHNASRKCFVQSPQNCKYMKFSIFVSPKFSPGHVEFNLDNTSQVFLFKIWKKICFFFRNLWPFHFWAVSDPLLRVALFFVKILICFRLCINDSFLGEYF